MRRSRLLPLLLAVLGAMAGSAASAQTVWRVGGEGPLATVGAALDRAAAGDTIRVGPGLYRERLVVERAVTLIGEGRPVLDGGGHGHVVEARAPVTLRGFVLRGSGDRPEREDAGVLVHGAPARIEDNRLEDVLYGVYLKEAPGSVVRGNEIRGKSLPLERRGDGIRLWYSHGSRIVENDVRGTRDVVLYFSDRLLVRGNTIREGRYGLHTMYSHQGRFLDNRVEDNLVGAFLMYSEGLELRGNVLADAAGASGMGLGLKDADRVTATGNLVAGNAVGIHLDNSPRGEDAANRFLDNALVANGAAVRLLPSVRGNRFHGNAFVANARPAEVAGGSRRGQAGQNDWRGNHWGGYVGFDEDGDGVGDTPYRHVRLGEELLGRHPALRIFSGSPALALLDLLGRFLPLLEPEPVVVDPAPRLESRAVERWRGRLVGARGADGSASATLLWLLAAVGAVALAGWGARGSLG